MSSKYDKFMKKMSIPNNNREVFFLSLILIFAIFCRLLPFAAITLIFVGLILFVIGYDFYAYTNKNAKQENKHEKTTEFSWGFVKQEADSLDLNTAVKYLGSKDFAFYKNYLLINRNKIIVLIFFLGDLIVAFKNLDMFFSGIYIALSIFTKFVFLGYIFLRQSYAKVLVGDRDTEENILDIFYHRVKLIK